jgi:hypothetical protein
MCLSKSEIFRKSITESLDLRRHFEDALGSVTVCMQDPQEILLLTCFCSDPQEEYPHAFR